MSCAAACHICVPIYLEWADPCVQALICGDVSSVASVARSLCSASAGFSLGLIIRTPILAAASGLGNFVSTLVDTPL